MSDTIPESATQYNASHTKQCSRCRDWLPFSAFSGHHTKKDGLNCYCRKCKVKNQRESRTPERSRQYKLRSEFGITLKQYDRMLEAQGGVCAVCHQPETHPDNHSKAKQARRLSIDHDHRTGDVRALLCSSCNVALGRMNEDPERIRALAEYAEWCQTREPSSKIIQLPLFSQG